MNILFFAGELFGFISLLLWFVFLPGFFLLNKATYILSKIEKLVLAISLGSVIFTLLLYIFGLLKIIYAAYIIISIFNIINIGKYKTHLNKEYLYNLFSINRNNLSLVLIIISTVIFSGSLLFLSGRETPMGLLFTEYRDAFWHLGLMKELVRSIPPIHPGFAPELLTNYHFFTHLFGAGFLNPPIFNHLDFYFRIFPFFLVFLYALNLYILGRVLTKSQLGGNLAIIFGLLTGSFAYVLPFFLKYKGFDWHESSFWLSQPFSMVINPSFALSSGLFLSAIFLIFKISTFKNSNLTLPLIIISGTLISFKVYAGLLILGGLLVVGIHCLWKNKSLFWLRIFCGSLIISLILFLPTAGKEAGKFMVFLPGWYLRSMVESPDRVQIVDWILRENTYAAFGNILGILKYRFYEFIIYTIGNLGIRLIGLIYIYKIVRQKISFSTGNLFIFATATAGFVIPLLFVQDGSIANTLQFSYYTLELMTLLFVIWLTHLLEKRGNAIKLIIAGIFLIVAVPTSIKVWYESLINYKPMVVDKTQLASFSDFLEKETKSDDIILVPSTYYYLNSLIVGTLSNRRLYYSDRLMAENTHKNFKEREQNVNKFFNSHDTGWNTSFLKDNYISYVYLDRDSVPTFNLRYYPLRKVFGQNKIEIYQVL